MTTVSLQKLLHDGDATQNLELADNAIVYVTGAETIRVQVLGRGLAAGQRRGERRRPAFDGARARRRGGVGQA